MKKQLLIGLSISLTAGVYAQNPNVTGVKSQKVNPVAAHQKMQYKKHQELGSTDGSFESMIYSLNPNTPPENRAFTSVAIGTTQYQLQTNASICNRIVKNSDGTISATWTMSQVADNVWGDRGTGYNYFDGTSWGTPPTARIESVRTGFVNIGVTNTGAEVDVAHETAITELHVCTRPVKGTGTWTESSMGVPDVWARMVVGGNNGHTLHVISQTSGAATSVIPYHGQDGAVSYSRSLDGGLTWDKLRTVIPQIDSSHYLGFGGDSYAIDARHDTIVIVAGGFDVDVVLLKSIDNGNSWTKTVVKRFPIPMYDSGTMVTDTGLVPDGNIDTLETNDASLAVLLDNQGKAHVWYGRMRVLCDNPGTGTGQGLSFFPATDGIMYWNENMGATEPVMITSVLDLDYAGHPADGLLNVDFDNTTGGLWGFGTFNRSLTSFPSAGIDANGRLFLSYSGIFEGTNDAGTAVPGAGSASPGKSYRHNYLMRSDDNGVTWGAPVDITDPDILSGTYDYTEGVYGAMAPRVDGFVHLIVQQDASPGHGVSTATTPDPQTGIATILYYKVPISDLPADVNEHKGDLSSVISLYPNPASASVKLKFNLAKASKSDVKIYNVMGQNIADFNNESVTNGTVLDINVSNYKAGIYFVNATVDGKLFSQKLVIQ